MCSTQIIEEYLLKTFSFVPADSAELGITDKILTKIHTQESVSKVCCKSCSLNSEPNYVRFKAPS